MSNEELIRRFESDLVPEDSFHHADHVRLAFAYLCKYPALPALEKFSAALKRFAGGHGKTQLYNGNHHLRIFLSDTRTDGTLQNSELGGVRQSESRAAYLERRSSEPLLSGGHPEIRFGP
jgi:hypothetical protein